MFGILEEKKKPTRQATEAARSGVRITIKATMLYGWVATGSRSDVVQGLQRVTQEGTKMAAHL
jgi:hypothetical protein